MLRLWGKRVQLNQLLHKAGHSADISGGMFTLAVLASGDIVHSVTDRYPHDVSFGLTIGTSRMATDQWKTVLQTGRTLGPTQTPVLRENFFPVPVVKITVDGKLEEKAPELW